MMKVMIYIMCILCTVIISCSTDNIRVSPVKGRAIQSREDIREYSSEMDKNE